MKFRIEIRNEALGTLKHGYTFDTLAAAQEYCEAQAKRCQKFVTLQPCEESSGKLVGTQIRGNPS